MAREYQVGFAECDITPAPGQAFMSGYGKPRTCSGVLSPLSAQALAVRDAQGHIGLIITADVLGFGATTVARLRHHLSVSHALAPASIVLCASHTHWGPTAQLRMNYQTGGMNIWYLRDMERKLLAIADEALNSLVPATISQGSTDLRLGHNRRVPQPDGTVGWGVNVDASYDTHTPVIHIERTGKATGVKRIVLTSHACHPTGSGGINKWWHEYPGVMRETITKTWGRDTRAMFIMGCGADAKLTHKDPKTKQFTFSASPARARQAGRRLAKAAMKRIGDHGAMSPVTGPLHMTSAAGTLTMKPAKSQRELMRMAYEGDDSLHTTWWARQMLEYPDSRRDYPYEVIAWRFGDGVTMLFLPGEVCSGLGPISRSLCGTGAAMSLAYCNRTDAYIPTATVAREGGYEGDDSHMAYFLPGPFTTKVEKQFTDIVQQAVAK